MTPPGVGKSSGETKMMQQKHTLCDELCDGAMTLMCRDFSCGPPSWRRIPQTWLSALTTTAGNPATLKAL
jgi:hypothetical protein